LILGVTDARQITGVGDPDRAMQTVDVVAYQNCEPPLTVVQETVATPGGETVVVVNVPKGDQRPYRTNRGVYYTRTSFGRRQASRQELLRLFQAAESLFYDETLILRASLADLDLAAFRSFVQQVYGRGAEGFLAGDEGLLRNLGLARAQNGELHPTAACLLFFGREPQRFLPQAHVVAAAIPGRDLAAAPGDAKQITGVLPTILEDSARFLNIHLRTAHRIQGFEPEIRSELPAEALRETLVNALAHRDYTVLAPVRVFVFDDRVEVRTPGGLPNAVTIEAMKLGAAHVLRNPMIYILFSRLGFVTGIGSGVYRTIQLVRQAIGREPNIYQEANELVVALPRRQNLSF
jgi:ATP-dependent DNA helicase RecG